MNFFSFFNNKNLENALYDKLKDPKVVKELKEIQKKQFLSNATNTNPKPIKKSN